MKKQEKNEVERKQRKKGKGNDECILSDERKLEEKGKGKEEAEKAKQGEDFVFLWLNWCGLKCVLSGKMKHDLEKQRKRENYGKKIKIKNYEKAKGEEKKGVKETWKANCDKEDANKREWWG